MGKKLYMAKAMMAGNRPRRPRPRSWPVGTKQELRGGLEVKRAKFLTFKELHDWYFALPEVQERKSMETNVNTLNTLLTTSGTNNPLNRFEMDQQGHYRAFPEKGRGSGWHDQT